MCNLAVCKLSFYYYFNSSDPSNNKTTSAMSVYIEQTDIQRRVVIWQSTFQPMDKQSWRYITIPLRRVNHPFRVVFRAAKSYSTRGLYHAISRVTMSSCMPPQPSTYSCSGSSNFKCNNNVCIQAAYRCGKSIQPLLDFNISFVGLFLF